MTSTRARGRGDPRLVFGEHRLERALVARRRGSRLRPRLRLGTCLGGEHVAARDLRDGVEDGFDGARDQTVGLEGVAEGVDQPSGAVLQPASPRPGDRLDVNLAGADQRGDAGAIESLDVHSLVGVTIGRPLGEAGRQEEMHHLRRVAGGERGGGERP